MEACRMKTPPLVSVLAVLLLLALPEVSVGLELSPSVTELILETNSSFFVVCSGWGRVTWKSPQEPALEGVRVEDHGTSSVLVLNNVTARHSGNYVCEEPSSDETKDLAIFIPDPEMWFVPLGPGVVMKEGEEGTIPCVVSDPRINVTLYERSGLIPVEGQYEPSTGFSAKLKDSSYICRGTLEGEERESTVYYVYSIIVPKSMNAFMTVSQTVVRQGDPLMVNCTVREAEMVFFRWTYPRTEIIEPLTEFLSSRELRIRSFLNISSARLEDSGLYVCMVQESVQGQTAMDNLTVTVLARGYVDLDPDVLTNVSVLRYETVELMVQVEAFPTPNVTWTRGNSTLAGDTISAVTTQVHETSYRSVLTLVRVRMEQKGLYTVQVTNEDDAKEVTFNLEVTAPVAPPRILDLSDQHVEVGHAVQCITEGVPTPTIHWYSCSSTQRCSNQTTAWRVLTSDLVGVVVQENVTTQEERGIEQVRSVLTLESVAAVTAVRCEARNNRGRRARDIRLVSNSLFSQVAVLAAVLALVVIAVIFLIILIALWRKKPRYDIRWKVIESVSSDGQEYTYMDPMHLPYDSVWELPRDSLVLGHTLGSGAFGRVVEATAHSLGPAQTTTKVAVKMLKSTARRSETQALISELKIMSHLGPHLNIVNLLGACTKRGPIFLVTEYCRHGDLVDYLHRSKHTYLQNHTERSRREGGSSSTENMENTSPTQGRSESDGGYMDMTKEESLEYVAMQEQTNVIEYADIEPCVYEMPYQHDTGYQEQGPGRAVLSVNDSPVLSFTDLLGFSFQVAQGMDFLASRNCIHRDLAARNVLVCEGKLVKICDFGLARDVMNDSNYVAKGNTFLPLKWMAPESIFQNQYTTLSDVWSYGILLWEIFSLGGTPYPDIPMNEQFYAALKRGYRMPKPTHATEDIYGVICKCWDEKFEKRPEFSSLVQTIGNLLPDAYRKQYDQACQNFMRCEHPAVVRRTRPRTTDMQDTDPSEVEVVPRVELKETDPSHTAYIIPIPDITIETSGEVLDTPTDSTESPCGLDGHADGSTDEAPVPPAVEGQSTSTQCKEEPKPSACSSEVEESFL